MPQEPTALTNPTVWLKTLTAGHRGKDYHTAALGGEGEERDQQQLFPHLQRIQDRTSRLSRFTLNISWDWIQIQKRLSAIFLGSMESMVGSVGLGGVVLFLSSWGIRRCRQRQSRIVDRTSRCKKNCPPGVANTWAMPGLWLLHLDCVKLIIYGCQNYNHRWLKLYSNIKLDQDFCCQQ